LADEFQRSGRHAIFAPIDEAFQTPAIEGLEPKGEAKALEEQLQSADKGRLSDTLKHYLVKVR
jgi:hypothetical protein